MIVDKGTQWDREVVNKYGARWGQKFRWHLKYLVKKLLGEDTEAYQEKMRMNYETFYEILTASLVILPFFISICARFQRNCWPEDYHSLSCPRSNGKNHHQSSCRVWTCPNYVIVDDSRWYCMIVLLQTCVIVETIINYHDRFNGSLHTGAWKLTKRFFLLPNRYIINSKSWEINMTLKWWKNVTLLEWRWLERLWGQICWVRTVITTVYLGSIKIHEFGWAYFCKKSLVDLIVALWSLAGGWFLCFVIAFFFCHE